MLRKLGYSEKKAITEKTKQKKKLAGTMVTINVFMPPI